MPYIDPKDIEERNYQPVDLRGGLDLTTSKFTVPRGTLQDCLNYEATDQGYTRSQDLWPFDGTSNGALEDAFEVSGRYDSDFSGLFTQGGEVTWSASAGGATIGRGVVAYWTADYTPDSDYETPLLGIVDITGTAPTITHYFYDTATGATFSAVGSVEFLVGLSSGRAGTTTQSFLTRLNDSINPGRIVSTNTEHRPAYRGKVPGFGGVTGGFQFKDTVYAVRDYTAVAFEDGKYMSADSGAKSLVGQIIVNQVLDSAVVAQVVDLKVTSGDWCSGNATGILYLSHIVPAKKTPWAIGQSIPQESIQEHNGVYYFSPAAHTASALTEPLVGANWTSVWLPSTAPQDMIFSGSLRVQDGPAVATVASAETPRKGMLWKATSSGWTPQDTGWEIGFEDGKAAPNIRSTSLFSNSPLITELWQEVAAMSNGRTSWGDGLDCAPWTIGTPPSDTTVVSSEVTIPAGKYSEYIKLPLLSSLTRDPEGLELVGILLNVEAYTSASTTGVITHEVLLVNEKTGAEWYMSPNQSEFGEIAASTDSFRYQTFGSAQSLWEVEGLTTADTISGDLYVAIRYYNSAATARTVTIFDTLVTLWHRQLTQPAYFWDGTTDVCTADIVSAQALGSAQIWTDDVAVSAVSASAIMYIYEYEATSGTIDSVKVDGVQLLGSQVAYDTDAATTATAVAANITANTSSPNYEATSTGPAVYILADSDAGSAPNGFDVTSWGVGVDTFDTDMEGGVDYAAAPLLPEGVMTLTNVSAPYKLRTGLEVRSGPTGFGSLIATTTTAGSYNTLPSAAEMAAAKSQYTSVEANFYLDADDESTYTATGASPAFTYDGTNFSYIHTPFKSSRDKPRHIEFHLNMLALGYDTGHVLLSVIGEPLDFRGVSGGTSWGFRSAITGLKTLPGEVLSVLTRESTGSLEGTDPSSIKLKNIQANSGAREYTMQQVIAPFFLDYYGISTLDATAKYGDFSFGRVSEMITPWLRGRLQDQSSTSGASRTVKGSVVIHNKNQYRLYFNDGYILTASFFTGRGVEFTWQHYDTVHLSNTYVPNFTHTTVLSTGRERAIMGCNNGWVYVIDGNNNALETSRDAYITLNPTNLGKPESVTKYMHTVVMGQFYGWEVIEAWAATNYVFTSTGGAQATAVIGDPTGAVQLEANSELDSIYLPILADGFSIKLQTQVDGSKPHTLQSLLLRSTTKGTDRTRTSKVY